MFKNFQFTPILHFSKQFNHSCFFDFIQNFISGEQHAIHFQHEIFEKGYAAIVRM